MPVCWEVYLSLVGRSPIDRLLDGRLGARSTDHTGRTVKVLVLMLCDIIAHTEKG